MKPTRCTLLLSIFI